MDQKPDDIFHWLLAVKHQDGRIDSKLQLYFVHDFTVDDIVHAFLVNESLEDDSLVLINRRFYEEDSVAILLDKRPRCLEELKIKLDLLDCE